MMSSVPCAVSIFNMYALKSIQITTGVCRWNHKPFACVCANRNSTSWINRIREYLSARTEAYTCDAKPNKFILLINDKFIQYRKISYKQAIWDAVSNHRCQGVKKKKKIEIGMHGWPIKKKKKNWKGVMKPISKRKQLKIQPSCKKNAHKEERNMQI